MNFSALFRWFLDRKNVDWKKHSNHGSSSNTDSKRFFLRLGECLHTCDPEASVVVCGDLENPALLEIINFARKTHPAVKRMVTIDTTADYGRQPLRNFSYWGRFPSNPPAKIGSSKLGQGLDHAQVVPVSGDAVLFPKHPFPDSISRIGVIIFSNESYRHNMKALEQLMERISPTCILVEIRLTEQAYAVKAGCHLIPDCIWNAFGRGLKKQLECVFSGQMGSIYQFASS